MHVGGCRRTMKKIMKRKPIREHSILVTGGGCMESRDIRAVAQLLRTVPDRDAPALFLSQRCGDRTCQRCRGASDQSGQLPAVIVQRAN